jgi:hypothetical protein
MARASAIIQDLMEGQPAHVFVGLRPTDRPGAHILAPPPRRRSAARAFDVEHYTIDAEMQPATQSLIATAEVRFVPLDNNGQRGSPSS